jgi:hypothetical protein
MKTKIKEIQNYFKEKLLSNDFEIIKIDEYLLDISIDGYKFTIWLGNLNLPDCRKNYSGKLSFMDLQLSNDDATKLNEMLLPLIKKYRKDELLTAKIKEVEQLKKEIECTYEIVLNKEL